MDWFVGAGLDSLVGHRGGWCAARLAEHVAEANAVLRLAPVDLAHSPEFLILDEPFNGLDPIGRHELTMVLRTWIQRGKSLLFASHLLHEIESITQSFLLIFGGRLLASGTAEEVHSMMAGLPNEVARGMLRRYFCSSGGGR